MVILRWSLKLALRFHSFLYGVIDMVRQSRILRCWRRWLVLFLIADLFAVGFFLYQYMDASLPDKLYAFVGETEDISLPPGFGTEESKEVLQITNKDSGFSMVSKETGSYQVPVKLFGVVPVKNVDVQVIQKMKVAPSGEPIGIYVETNGLLVLDTAEVQGQDGLTYAPGENILKTGDYILKWNDKAVPTIAKLNQAIQDSGDKKVPVTIRRGSEQLKVAVKPIQATDHSYKIGTWVREDTQGIGTLTYVTEDGNFGTLGHGITDSDTGTLLNLHGGELYKTRILGITKGASGEPGELQGYINMVADNVIGEITKNTELGVFGKMRKASKNNYAGEYMPVGRKQEIRQGPAYIYVNLDGTARKYKIRIEEINMNSRDNKSMILRITDSRLRAMTGGIVQGMSGSPIIQDGKVIGAVTHVLVDDPAQGYGVFIENMLAQG